MNTVYVVIYEYHEEYEDHGEVFMGVFSSQEKAQEFVNNSKILKDDDHEFFIIEREIDKP